MNEQPQKPSNSTEAGVETPTDDKRARVKAAKANLKQAKSAVKIAKKAAIQAKKEVEALKKSLHKKSREGVKITPISPPSGPDHWLFQGPPAQSKFLAAKANS